MDSPCIKQTVCKVLKIFQYGKYLVAYVLKCLKLYSLKFAIAHAQIKIVILIKLVLIVLHKNTRKLLNHLKQTQKSISNLANV